MSTLKVKVAEDQSHSFNGGPGSVLSGDTLSGAGSGIGDNESVLEISTDKLTESMRDLQTQLAQIFADIRTVGAFELSSIELGLEINSEGGFNLIGSLKAGAKGAIKLKFEPPAPGASG